MPLPPETHIGSVHLTVADLDSQHTFYERALGLEVLEREGQTVRLGPPDGPVILELTGNPDAPPRPPAGTHIGHMHLQVANLSDAEAFYSGALGFDVMVRTYPGALFVSAGGYHHHIGLNTWESAGGSPPPEGSTGLRSFEVVFPSREEADRVAAQARAAGAEVSTSDGAAIVLDPWRDAVLLTA